MFLRADSYQPLLIEKKKCYVSFSAPICVLNHLVLVSSADNLFKQLGPRSDSAKLSCENGACEVPYEPSLLERKVFFLFFKCTFLFFNFLSYFTALSFLAGIRLGYVQSHISILCLRGKCCFFQRSSHSVRFSLLVPFFPQPSVQFC